MRATTSLIDLDADRAVELWSCAFDIQVSNARFVQMLALVKGVRGDVYTSRLPYTSHLYGAIATGGVSLLRGGESGIGLADVLDTLLLISLHQKMARCCAGRLREPAFWIKATLGEGEDARRAPRPVMTFGQLSILSGRREEVLRAILAPLVRDGAVRVVQAGGGAEGVHLVDGYVDDVSARSFYRI
jgi:hypothetical protein